MSRTGKDIPSRVHIAIVDATAITAYPLPYSKVCLATRPRVGKASTTRTDLGRKPLIDFLILRAMLNSLVREHRTEARPRSIEHGLGHLGPSQSCGVDISNRDVVKLPHDAMRELVQEIPAGIRDVGVDASCQAFLARSLRLTQSFFQASIIVGILDLLARRESGKLFQSQINSNAALKRSGWRVGKLDRDVQEPVSPSITTEVRSVPDLAFGQRAGMKHAERITPIPECLTVTLEVAAFQRNPCKGLLAAIAQVWPPVLPSRLDVLLTYCVYRPRVQSELLSASGGQDIEVEPTRPTLVPFKSVLLGLVAVVPNVVHRAALLVQQTAERLHSIAVNQNHCIIIQEQRFPLKLE